LGDFFDRNSLVRMVEGRDKGGEKKNRGLSLRHGQDGRSQQRPPEDRARVRFRRNSLRRPREAGKRKNVVVFGGGGPTLRSGTRREESLGGGEEGIGGAFQPGGEEKKTGREKNQRRESSRRSKTTRDMQTGGMRGRGGSKILQHRRKKGGGGRGGEQEAYNVEDAHRPDSRGSQKKSKGCIGYGGRKAKGGGHGGLGMENLGCANEGGIFATGEREEERAYRLPGKAFLVNQMKASRRGKKKKRGKKTAEKCRQGNSQVEGGLFREKGKKGGGFVEIRFVAIFLKGEEGPKERREGKRMSNGNRTHSLSEVWRNEMKKKT